MNHVPSLRTRLILIILIPLLGISVLIGAWAVGDAQSRASDRFDRSLLSAALAISRDVAVSGGDALSPETGQLLRDTSGGRVFYHVYAPDGVFVTGYATPPVPPQAVLQEQNQQIYFDATYLGRDVRVLRFQDAMQIEGWIGDFTFTVWQDTRLRDAIVRGLSIRTFNVMATLVTALALIVWFGVRFGLSPLTDLQSAIARRSSDELDPIKRQVPHEVQGIVTTLNKLLGQVASSMQAKDDFVSNAAHQLRNPIAGVLAMSEAVQAARTMEDMQERSVDLVAASRHASDLANKLLTFERAKASVVHQDMPETDIAEIVRAAVAAQAHACSTKNIKLTMTLQPGQRPVRCDPVMIREAITNLIDNALVHGGPNLSTITVSVSNSPAAVQVQVKDDGKGMLPSDIDHALERFGQLEPSGGSGLGLAIAKAVALSHGGELRLDTGGPGLVVNLLLPLP